MCIESVPRSREFPTPLAVVVIVLFLVAVEVTGPEGDSVVASVTTAASAVALLIHAVRTCGGDWG
jgi:hypothetical protein